MADALPEAARRRTYPLLLGDWTAAVCYPWELQPSGGVSYVRRNDLVEVIRRIGTTHQPVAVITAHTHTHRAISSWMAMSTARSLSMYESLTLGNSETSPWRGTLSNWASLSMCTPLCPDHSWWLEETMSRDDCWSLAEGFPDACGLAAKSSNPPRYAIRFQTREQMESAMRANGEGQQGTYGRYKASGIPTSAGFVGAWQLLKEAGYEVEEVVYHADNSLVFMASKSGSPSFHYLHAGFNYPVKVKAVNSVARAQVQEQSGLQQPACAETHTRAETKAGGHRSSKRQGGSTASSSNRGLAWRGCTHGGSISRTQSATEGAHTRKQTQK
eukprot:2597534-Amphidinium_carterae.2